MLSELPVWAADLPRIQQLRLHDNLSYAKLLALQVSQTPNFCALVLDHLAPGFGDLLMQVAKQPELLHELRNRLSRNERLVPPTGCNNGGFGGV